MALRFNSFHFDITDCLNKDNTPNVLAVRLENRPEQSRWYPGAGIYRNVHVIITNEVHIPVWGTYVTTPVVNDDFAKINIRTKVANTKQNGDYKLVTQILSPEGKVVGSAETKLNKYSQAEFNQDVYLDEYKLWDVSNPNLYKAVSKLYSNGKQVDEYSTTFGIRTIDIRPNDGFYLNGKKIVFKGVCMHHDLGPWCGCK